MRPFPPSVSLILAFMTALSSLSAQTSYEVDHLGAFGGTKSFPTDINDAGIVVGYTEHVYALGSQFTSWQWVDGTGFDIPSLGGINCFTYGTNNSQEICGLVDWGQEPDGTWGSGLFPIESDLWLDTPTSQLAGIWGSFGRPSDMNDAGVIVGVANSADVSGMVHEIHGVIWDHGTVTELPTLGGDYSSASDINNLGQVAVSSKDASGVVRAAIWENGAYRQLPDLGYGAGLRAINDHGEVVGWVVDANGHSHAAHWDRHGLHDLGTLGGLESWANDINTDGIIVGQSGWLPGGGGGSHAFVVENGVMYDLNSIPTGTHNFAEISIARAVNAAGQIVGFGQTIGGYTRGWLADPLKLRLLAPSAAVAPSPTGGLKITCEGATPYGILYAFWGIYSGHSAQQGADVGIANPRALGMMTADSLGFAEFDQLPVSANAAGRRLILQVVDASPAGATTSNRITLVFRP